jgi:hypothetical protein
MSVKSIATRRGAHDLQSDEVHWWRVEGRVQDATVDAR